MRRHPRLVNWLWRWHRRLGLAAALFVLLLAGSGILLNHTADLGLERRFIEWPLLHRLYGERSGDRSAYQLGGRWLSRAADGTVYLDVQSVAPCRGDLVGAALQGAILVVACARELLLLTDDGDLIESVTASTGLPTPLTGVGLVDAHQLAVQVGDQWRLADLEQIDFSARAAGGSLIRQLAPAPLPSVIRDALPDQAQWLSWERLLLDVHSGRLAGRIGVLLVDAIGVLLCALALSGIAMWWLHRRRRQRR